MSSHQAARAHAAAWASFREDRVALIGLILFVSMFVACFVVEPLLVMLLGHGPDDPFPYAVSSPESLTPVGPFTWVPDVHVYGAVGVHTPQTLLLLGADGPLGRDELLRILVGGQVSLEVALGAGAIAVVIGTITGLVSGYFGGATDVLIGRLTEFVMAFPLLLLVIAIGQTVALRYSHVTLHLFRPGVISVMAVLGFFTWFQLARIVRAETSALKQRDWVEAARALGAGELHVMRHHVIPHLSGPIIVWGAFCIATNIILESVLSFLNLGVMLPTASWGNMLSSTWGTLFNFGQVQSETEVVSQWVYFWPAIAIFCGVLSLLATAEGLRRALDPGSHH